jgi:hypothetical protein
MPANERQLARARRDQERHQERLAAQQEREVILSQPATDVSELLPGLRALAAHFGTPAKGQRPRKQVHRR